MDAKVFEALLARVEALEAKVAALEAEGGGPPVPDSLDLLGQADDPMAMVREAISFWNLMAGVRGLSHASITKVSSPRAQAIRRCLKHVRGIEGWKRAMKEVAASNWLCGKSGNGTWKATLDFITKESKFTKLMEGGYDHDYGKSNGSQGLAPSGRGPSRDDIRRGALAGLEASGRLETEGRSES